jgi:hypothetical protein
MNSKASGFSALAYPSSDPASPVLLSFIFKHSKKRAQVTLCLVQSFIFLKGFDDAQTFVLQYDADKIVPDSTSLGPVTILLPQDRFDAIAHSKTPQIQTLSFKLKSCCPIWGPRPASTVPKHGSEALFTQLGNLAIATELCIVFDSTWLHPTECAVLQRLVQDPAQFSGFPVSRYYETFLRCMHESVFNPPSNDNATADSDATTEDEDEDEPPSYAKVSRKRPRHSKFVLFARAHHKRLTRNKASVSPSPAQRRVPLPPYSEHLPTSPNEKGSTVASSPKPPPSPTIAALAPDIQKAVKEAVYGAVAELLPSTLKALLPELLTAGQPPSPSPSPSASSKTSTPPLLKLSSLGSLLSEYVARGVKRELRTIIETTASHAADIRDVADTEFFEVLADYKVDVNMAKDDCVDDLSRVTEEMLKEFKAKCKAEMETLDASVDLKVMTVYEDFEERMENLRKERGWLGKKPIRLGIWDDSAKGSIVKPGSRAGSAPL